MYVWGGLVCRIRAGGGLSAWELGGCLKYKRRRIEKRGGETKNVKRGQAGSSGGYFKKRGAGTPLQTMDQELVH